MDLVSYVSAIKIDVDGLCTSQAQCFLRHHVQCKLIKIPQLAMQSEREGGMISQGIGRGKHSNP